MTNEIDDRPTPPAKRQRIAKLMARAGLCSRRDAETWIVAGRVSVNGEVLASPARDIDANDVILVDGAPLRAADKTRLFLFHKPRGLVTSDRDPEGRMTVFDYLRENWPEGPRVVSVGRLDINTEGLLLLTNDGGLARVLELPQTGWVRRYRVRAKGTTDPAALDALADGIRIDGIDYASIEAKLDRVQGANCWLTVGLREGKNREVKRVLEYVGLEVNRLIRISFGPFQLLDLPEGAVEEVRTRVLRDQLGPSLSAEADASFEVEDPKKQESVPKETRDLKPLRKANARGNRSPAGDKQRRTGEEPAPRRDRPTGRSRKHVSSLRAAERTAARDGPRKRIERSDTQDRRSRTVTVERLVSTQPARAEEQPSAQSFRRAGAEGDRREPRNKRFAGRTDKRNRDRDKQVTPDRKRGARSDESRRRESPSAEGKKQRIMRSGAVRSEGKAPKTEADQNGSPRRGTNKARSHGSRTRPREASAAHTQRAKPHSKSRGPSRRPKR